MDEPTASLDPTATYRIEELLDTLKASYTIVIVTHSLSQAARISDYTAFFMIGEVMEYEETAKLFQTPTHPQTENYIRGRFG
jgi:phosphate transport system ATP-binding protein